MMKGWCVQVPVVEFGQETLKKRRTRNPLQQKVNNNGLVCNTQNSLRSILAGLSGAEKNGTVLYPVK
jgi:hypothetical protein